MQKQVDKSFAEGFPGMKAAGSPSFYYPQGLIAEENIKAGTFVWLGSNPEKEAKNAGSAGVKPIGLVEKILVSCGYEDYYPAGYPLAVAACGEYWVVTLSETKAGDRVFARLTDGAISTAAAGSKLNGYIETNWQAVTSAAVGHPVIISNTFGE